MSKQNDIIEKRNSIGATRKEFSDTLGFSKEQEKLLKLWETGLIEIPNQIYNKIMSFLSIPQYKLGKRKNYKFTMIDLFAGIGGIRLAFQKNGVYTVYSSEWDKFACKTYKANFDEIPDGDITKVKETSIPNHDILVAGFPCQPFSKAGLEKGFEDTRGTLFFDIARILKSKRPKAFMLENVKNLSTHDKGKTIEVIINVLEELNYYVPNPKVLNALDFGVPQNRERTIIVGFNKEFLPKQYKLFTFPIGSKRGSINVGDILEENVSEKYTISDKLYQGHIRRKKEHKIKGNGFGFNLYDSESKYTGTISARYYKDGSDALVYQESANPRMLTPRECARLQGFPEDFVIPVSNTQAYRQFGNSVSIPVIERVAEKVVDYVKYMNKHNGYEVIHKK